MKNALADKEEEVRGIQQRFEEEAEAIRQENERNYQELKEVYSQQIDRQKAFF